MNKPLISTMLGCSLIAVAATAQAPIKQKPGLYDVTTQMDMGMAGMPPMPPRTSQVCVTQAMIDKYGGGFGSAQSGCQSTNVVTTSTGMTANVSCTGRLNMTGTVKTTYVDADTVKTTIQMSGTMPNGQAMNMTTQMTFAYKGADCGSVKPPPMAPSAPPAAPPPTPPSGNL